MKGRTNMKVKKKTPWNYITITAVSLLLLTVFSIFYSSTITNQMHRVEENSVREVVVEANS